MYENWDLKYFVSRAVTYGESLCTTILLRRIWVFRTLSAAAVAAKANCILGLISKCFEHLDVDTLPLLYKTLVCPILEYANAIYGAVLYH